jgi:hypothetical protein
MASNARKMRTIEATATVTTEGTLTVQVPKDIPPGEHAVVIVLGDTAHPLKTRSPLDFPVHDSGPWPTDLSLRREDLYGDRGR